jgi:hypothetical protein
MEVITIYSWRKVMLRIRPTDLKQCSDLMQLRRAPEVFDGKCSWKNCYAVKYETGDNILVGATDQKITVVSRVPVSGESPPWEATVNCKGFNALAQYGGSRSYDVDPTDPIVVTKAPVFQYPIFHVNVVGQFPWDMPGGEQVDQALLDADLLRLVLKTLVGAGRPSDPKSPTSICSFYKDIAICGTDDVYYSVPNPGLSFEMHLSQEIAQLVCNWIKLAMPETTVLPDVENVFERKSPSPRETILACETSAIEASVEEVAVVEEAMLENDTVAIEDVEESDGPLTLPDTDLPDYSEGLPVGAPTCLDVTGTSKSSDEEAPAAASPILAAIAPCMLKVTKTVVDGLEWFSFETENGRHGLRVPGASKSFPLERIQFIESGNTPFHVRFQRRDLMTPAKLFSSPTFEALTCQIHFANASSPRQNHKTSPNVGPSVPKGARTPDDLRCVFRATFEDERIETDAWSVESENINNATSLSNDLSCNIAPFKINAYRLALGLRRQMRYVTITFRQNSAYLCIQSNTVLSYPTRKLTITSHIRILPIREPVVALPRPVQEVGVGVPQLVLEDQ